MPLNKEAEKNNPCLKVKQTVLKNTLYNSLQRCNNILPSNMLIVFV